MDLDRFLAAQATTHDAALAELSHGRKTSHWMWWEFPQLPLGHSPTARAYALASLDEARAYLAHPVLGPRLRVLVAAAIAAPGSAEAVFGGIDAIKLRSSLTLFARAAGDPAPFRAGLDRFFGGEEDAATVGLLEQA